ncbi:BlyB family putative holin accessory protein [Borrelia sp. P9F1]|uniref:BlyB family putative holin accessory protein n=1 Tax=Borrelia sp. P9F1 TaxID=3058374 RepID=UPI002647ED69|nr:BlyB family putative holin accessory protein [Borrelia sp. P9F1]WKC58468.1 BlyB family putative holin accessory protein [Borrelia sp. P9F1]
MSGRDKLNPQSEGTTAALNTDAVQLQASNINIGGLLYSVSSILKFANIEHPVVNKIVEGSRIIYELVGFTQSIYNSIIATNEDKEQERYKQEMIDIINVAGQIISNSSDSHEKKELLEKLRAQRNKLAAEKIEALKREMANESTF